MGHNIEKGWLSPAKESASSTTETSHFHFTSKRANFKITNYFYFSITIKVNFKIQNLKELTKCKKIKPVVSYSGDAYGHMERAQ